jgi:hypothetical protein
MRKTIQLKHSATLGLDPDIMRSLVITAVDDFDAHSNNGPTLPAELVSKIILELQQDRQYAVLAKMAQVNSTFYDLVIPKLYETVTITAENKYRMYYGLHPSQYHKWSTLVDDNGNTIIDPDEPPYNNTKTRKDRAIEWCRRLIIDTPTEELVNSIEYVVDLLPHHRYGKVEELIVIRRAMRNPRADEDTWSLFKILPPFAPLGTRDEDVDQIPQIKRVMIHVADDFGRPHPMFRTLSVWCKQRNRFRAPTQFAIHNIRLGSPPYHLDYMDIDCHFYRHTSPSGYFAEELSLWLLPLFDGRLSSGPQLKFFNVYRFLMRDVDTPQDPEQASKRARCIIERDLGKLDCIWKDEPQYKAECIRKIMASITFHTAEYEEEYPVSRPLPVSHVSVVKTDD